jgi:hypothetical protein
MTKKITVDLQTESGEVKRILKEISEYGSISKLHSEKVEKLFYSEKDVKNMLGAGMQNIFKRN